MTEDLTRVLMDDLVAECLQVLLRVEDLSRQGFKKKIFAEIEARKFVRSDGPYDRHGKTLSVSCRRVGLRAVRHHRFLYLMLYGFDDCERVMMQKKRLVAALTIAKKIIPSWFCHEDHCSCD